MSAKSAEMISLLQELALLKQLGEKDGDSNVEPLTAESQCRRNRLREISEQIKALGDSKI